MITRIVIDAEGYSPEWVLGEIWRFIAHHPSFVHGQVRITETMTIGELWRYSPDGALAASHDGAIEYNAGATDVSQDIPYAS